MLTETIAAELPPATKARVKAMQLLEDRIESPVAEGMAISIVVWASQWSRFQGQMKEGSKVTLDVRVPKEGYSAFSLVAVV